jgi:uncharacterized phage protein (TIGR02220 family)
MDEVKRENGQRFTLTDSSILERSDLDCYAKLVYVMLCKFADSEKRCFPSRSTLAELVGCSKPIIGRSIKKLEEIGAIEVVNRTGSDKSLISNLYIIKDLHTPSKSDYLPLGNVITYPRKPGYLPLGNHVTPNYNHINSTQINYKSIVEFLNEKCGTSYRSSTVKTQRLIKARFNEGFTEEDFRKVIETKARDWLGTEMEQYLRPETLFGTKFEGYLNQKGGGKSDVKRGRAEPDEEPGRDFSDLYL